MKRKYTLFIISIFLICLIPVAAQNKKQFDIEKFKEQKAQFIVSEVGLTESESKAFIPLANELMDKRFHLNRSVKKDARELREKQNKTDADYDRQIEAGFNSRAKELELDREYYQKFKKVLSPEKIYKYQKAENKFMRNMFGQDKNTGRSRKR